MICQENSPAVKIRKKLFFFSARTHRPFYEHYEKQHHSDCDYRMCDPRTAGYCRIRSARKIGARHLRAAAHDKHDYSRSHTDKIYEIRGSCKFAFGKSKKLFKYCSEQKTAATERESHRMSRRHSRTAYAERQRHTVIYDPNGKTRRRKNRSSDNKTFDLHLHTPLLFYSISRAHLRGMFSLYYA